VFPRSRLFKGGNNHVASSRASARAQLIDQIPSGRLTVIISLLEVIVDPVGYAIAHAPADDEPAGIPIASAPRNTSTSHKDFLAELGLTQEDIDSATEQSAAA
jgi:hypothetical protein